MEYTQDGVTYRIKNSVVTRWKGKSPFRSPVWTGTEIIEGRTGEDDDIQAQMLEDRTMKLKGIKVLFEGVTNDGLAEFAVGVNNNLKLVVVALQAKTD